MHPTVSSPTNLQLPLANWTVVEEAPGFFLMALSASHHRVSHFTLHSCSPRKLPFGVAACSLERNQLLLCLDNLRLKLRGLR